MSDERVAVTLTRIDTVVTRMESRLFGDDGDSGLLGRHAEQLAQLERTEAKAHGAFWAFGSLFTLLAGTLMRHLFGGGSR